MHQDSARALLTPGALALLDALPPEILAMNEFEAVATLRRQGFEPDTVAAVLTQARLRLRAREKFGEFAASMFFTDDSLQQATRLNVAAMHAGRFAQAGVVHVADLGCGIGADSLAFAGLGLAVTAVELDPVVAAFAAYNLAAWPRATVVNADAATVDLSGADGLFFDPARRTSVGGSSKRTFDPAAFSPSLDWVFGLARTKPSGVKLGPGHPHEAIPEGCEAQWVSIDGHAVELGLWFGATARGDQYSAFVRNRRGTDELVTVAESPHPEVGEVKAFLYEPDPAIIRSRGIATLASRLGLTRIDESIAYLTGDDDLTTPFATRYRVDEIMPFDRKRLGRRIRELDIGRLTVKKRGSDIDPAALQRQLRTKGDRAGVLFVTRAGGRHIAILTDVA